MFVFHTLPFFSTEYLKDHNRLLAILLYSFEIVLCFTFLLDLTLISLFMVFIFSFSSIFCWSSSILPTLWWPFLYLILSSFGLSLWLLVDGCSCLLQNEVLMVSEICLVFPANCCFPFWFLFLPQSLVLISCDQFPFSIVLSVSFYLHNVTHSKAYVWCH